MHIVHCTITQTNSYMKLYHLQMVHTDEPVQTDRKLLEDLIPTVNEEKNDWLSLKRSYQTIDSLLCV